MREILFRGKRMDNNEWIEGFYYKKPNPNTEDGLPIYHGISDIPPFGSEVIPETVGQFTGLHDKNGKKIFDGDIVAYRGDEYGVIVYDKETARFCVEFDVWSTDFDHLYGKEIEVVGNTHDNPELIDN